MLTDELDEVLKLSSERRVPRGTALFQKGDPGSSMMAVLSGCVRVSSVFAEGKEITLNVINPGEVFGEIALLDGKPRSVDCTAIEETTLLVLERRHFLPFLLRNEDLYLRLLAVLCEKLRRISMALEELELFDPTARFAQQTRTGVKDCWMRAEAEMANVRARRDADETRQLEKQATVMIATQLLSSIYPAEDVRTLLQDLAAKAPLRSLARTPAKPRLRWGTDNAPDENPAAFAWRAYQDEAKAGTLHRGIIGQEDKPLSVKLASWLRSHPMPEGIDIPTKPEWIARRLAEAKTAPRPVRVWTEEGRLYQSARYRAKKAAERKGDWSVNLLGQHYHIYSPYRHDNR